MTEKIGWTFKVKVNGLELKLTREDLKVLGAAAEALKPPQRFHIMKDDDQCCCNPCNVKLKFKWEKSKRKD